MQSIKAVFVLGAFSAASASAQISPGVLVGVPFTDVVNRAPEFTPKSTNFIIGPTFQVNLPLSLRFELDALYRPYSFSAASLNSAYSVSASQWTFPFLLQYRFSFPVVKPFVEAGASFDHLADISAVARSIPAGPGALLHKSNASLVLGAGVDVKIPKVRLSGELRYIHQGAVNFQSISNVNQAEMLFGVHF